MCAPEGSNRLQVGLRVAAAEERKVAVNVERVAEARAAAAVAAAVEALAA